MIFPLIGWWGHAHQLIARIAEMQLPNDSQNKITQVVNMGGFDFQTTVDCSTWQDDVKGKGIFPMGNWHFADEPIILDPNWHGEVNPPTYNVTAYLLDAMDTLLNPTTTSKWMWAFTLRSIIHFVADIHTPHHNCALFSDQFPKGDEGGNYYIITCNYGSMCNNLHFFWDAAGGKFPLNDPTSAPNWDAFQANATALLDDFYPKNRDLNAYLPAVWSHESHDVGVQYGYKTNQYERPTDAYFKSVQDAASDRIATAGLRLAAVLKTLVALPNFPISKDSSSISTSEIVMWVVNSLIAVWVVFVVVMQYRERIQYQNI